MKGVTRKVKQKLYRDTWAEIDLEAIKHNIIQMKHLLPKTSDIMAVVKANGYGHGATQVARKAIESGATSLAVALLEEALVLRQAGINVPILVLGRVAPEYTQVAAENQITLTFFQLEWIKEVKKMELSSSLKVHLKFDTGMGRVGIRSTDEISDMIVELAKNTHIHLAGVYTHFASADDADLTYFNQQKTKFERMLKYFKQLWKEPVQVHIGNSAASIRFPDEMYNTIRFGIGMYGLYPSDVIKAEHLINLKQAFSLQSKLVNVKKIAPGDGIGYGSDYIASQAEWIGTVQIGYGDGWTRKLQGFNVLIDGKKHPIVGRICMDQMMIRLDKSYNIGTKVTLIGRQQTEEIKIDDVAHFLETINYEIPCMLNERIPRIYLG